MKKTYITLVIAISAIALSVPSMKAQITQPYDYLTENPPLNPIVNTDLTQILPGQTTYILKQAPVTMALALNVQVPALATHPNWTSSSDSQLLTTSAEWYSWNINKVTSVYTPKSFTMSQATAIATTKYGNKEFLTDLLGAGIIPGSAINGWSLIATPFVDPTGIISYSIFCYNQSLQSYIQIDANGGSYDVLDVNGVNGASPLSQEISTTGGVNLNSSFSNLKSSGSSRYYTISTVSLGAGSQVVNPSLTQAQEASGVAGPLAAVTLSGRYRASASTISWSTVQNSVNVLPVPGSASFDGLVGVGTSGDNAAPVTVAGTLSIAASTAIKTIQVAAP